MSAEARSFVDTNVLVYAVDSADRAKREIARAALAERAGSLVLSAQVLSEFYVVTTRKLAVPLRDDEAAGYVAELSRLPIVATDAALVHDGVEISRQAQLSFWDGLIVAAARAGGCVRILTEDLAEGSPVGGIAIENPFAR